jgi:hypothetical protein
LIKRYAARVRFVPATKASTIDGFFSSGIHERINSLLTFCKPYLLTTTRHPRRQDALLPVRKDRAPPELVTLNPSKYPAFKFDCPAGKYIFRARAFIRAWANLSEFSRSFPSPFAGVAAEQSVRENEAISRHTRISPADVVGKGAADGIGFSSVWL